MPLKRIREEIKILLFHELTQQYLVNLFDNLASGAATTFRAAEQLYPTKDIQLPAVAQMHHFAVQQAVESSAASCNVPYRLTPTIPAGAHYPKIKSTSFDIVVRRSTSKKCWKKANYMLDLATLNSSYEGASDDIFDTTTRPPLEDSLFVVLDVYIQDKDTVFCSFLIPNSSLNKIHIDIPYNEIMEVSSLPESKSEDNRKPISRIKKTLHDLDDDKQQTVNGI